MNTLLHQITQCRCITSQVKILGDLLNFLVGYFGKTCHVSSSGCDGRQGIIGMNEVQDEKLHLKDLLLQYTCGTE